MGLGRGAGHVRVGGRRRRLVSPTAAAARNLMQVTAWIAAYNDRDFDRLATLATPDLRVDDPATDTHLVGWDAFRSTAEDIAARYPDRRITVTYLLALGDTAVAVEADWQATAAGRTIRHVEGMVIELVDGKIARRRIYR